ncbi:hypothetical protein PspS34_16600 [Pseudomonas sp. S34]|nr:hypothetical protein PspS34_16600 [Pseudomonas sp. S34]
MFACRVCIRMGWLGVIGTGGGRQHNHDRLHIAFNVGEEGEGSRSYLVDVSSQLLQPNERVQLFRAGFAGWRCIAGVAGELPLASH